MADDYGRLDLEEEKIVLFLLQNNKITRKEVIDTIGAHKTKAHEILSKMVDKKLIVRVGKGRSTHYILGDVADDK